MIGRAPLLVTLVALLAISAPAAAQLSAGQLAMQQGDYAKAKVEFEKVVKAAPKSPDAMKAWVNLGVIAVARGDFQGAVAAYDAALALKKDDSKALNGKATALLRLKRYDEALLVFEAAAMANPRDPLPFYNLGYLALQSHQIKTAEGLFQLALKADPSSTDAHAGMAQVALIENDFLQAQVEAKAALRMNPTNVAALLALGKAYIGMDRYAEAHEPLAKAFSLSKTDAEVPFTYGLALYGQGMHAKAGMAFADALDLAPDDPAIHLYGGLCFHQLGDVARASEEFTHVIKLGAKGRDRAMAHYHLGLIEDTKGNLKSAEQQYRAAVKADPRYPIAANNLGLVLQRTKRVSEAVVEFRRALSVDPDLHMARLNLGHALWVQGMKPQARVELEKLKSRLPPGNDLRVKAEQILMSDKS